MKILVVEDDVHAAQALELLLSNYNYAVDIAADGEMGAEMADTFEYDLMVLDVGLPRLDGLSLCQQLRNKGVKTPILLLTGQDEGAQKAAALNIGADDYVVKPFDAEELIARVQALLRRGASTVSPILAWDKLQLDPTNQRVSYATQMLSLTPKEYAILELLMRHPQQVFSAQSILDRVWNSADAPGEETVRFHIKALRQKLKAVGAPRDLVRTVYRVGYQLNPIYSPVPAAGTDSPSLLDVAELKSVNEELRKGLEALQVVQEELKQQNELLQHTSQAIERERLRYQDLFELAPDGYLITDLQGMIREANRAACTLLGVQLMRLLSSPLALYVAQDDRQVFRQRLNELRHRPVENWEIAVQPVQGSPIPVLVSVTPILDGQHHRVGLRWLLRDIRQRKQMEEELQAAHDHLECLVSERTAELVQANHQLRQQKDQWEALFNQALDAISIADDEGRYVDANPAACEVFGVPKEILLQSSVADFADPAVDVKRMWQHFLQVGTMAGEFPLYRPDGTVRITEFAAVANFMPHRHLSILRDISDRKQLETTLQTSEARLRDTLTQSQQTQTALQASEEQRRLALDLTGIGWWDWDIAADRLTWSDQVFRLLGYQLGAVTPSVTAWRDRIHSDDLDQLDQMLQQDLANHSDSEFEYRVVHPNGEVHWLLSKGRALYDAADQPMRMVGVVQDITERRQAEQAVRKQAALINIASDAIFVCNLNSCILFWSEGAERLYGWSAAEAVSQNAQELLAHESTAQLERALKAALEKGVWQGELSQKTKVGNRLTVQSRWTLMRDATGQPEALLVVNTDITEKQQIEQQVYRTQRLESIGTLASGIAHDLNNVFTPILTIAQMLALKQTEDARSQTLIELLQNSARRGANLVKQMLIFARGVDGEPAVLRPELLLQEVTAVIGQTFPKNIEIRIELPDQPLWPICADSTQIHQVLMNLCLNARDAMPQGGTLTLTGCNRAVDAAFAQCHLEAQVGDYLVMTITDTGTGIAPEHLDHIFDPFFTTKPVGQGTGLGLSTVLGIVRSHQGFLQVSTEVGKGTQFQVYLPAMLGPISETSMDNLPRFGNQELILIVDDEASVLQTNQALLESYGYTTLTAKNGLEATALYVKYQAEIQLVMLDIMMPKQDGLTTMQSLKKLNPQVKLIAVSGLPTHKDQALALGAKAFLSKPYTAQALLSACYQVLAA